MLRRGRVPSANRRRTRWRTFVQVGNSSDADPQQRCNMMCAASRLTIIEEMARWRRVALLAQSRARPSKTGGGRVAAVHRSSAYLDDRGGAAIGQAFVWQRRSSSQHRLGQNEPIKLSIKDSSVGPLHRVDFGERSLGLGGGGSWIRNSAWLRSSVCPSWARYRDRIWSMWSRPADGKTTMPGRRFSAIALLRPKSSFSPPARSG